MADRLERPKRTTLDSLNGRWKCLSCGALLNVGDPAWRWNGESWEHRCPGLHPQVGHCEAEEIQ